MDSQLKNWGVIDRLDQFQTFIEAIREAPYLALDTEFRREDTYFAELALIQIATDQHIACIDPLAITNLAPLIALISRSDVPTYIHSLYQDAEVLQQTLNCSIGKPYDTQIAAAFAGESAQISYRNAVAHATDIMIDKGASRSDWLARPLSNEQVRYALLDVAYLAEIKQHYDAHLSPQQKTWIWEESLRQATEASAPIARDGILARIKLREPLSDRQAQRLAALHIWREQYAIDQNLPRNWVAHDQTLLAIATTDEPDQTRIIDLLKADRRARSDIAPLLLDQLSMPLPDAPSFILLEQDPEQKKHLKTLSHIARAQCEAYDLPLSLTASNKMIKALLTGQPTPLTTGWRYEVVGKALIDANQAFETEMMASKT